MRTMILFVVALFVAATSSQASLVDHSDQAGVVATCGDNQSIESVLDRFGQVWLVQDWIREPQFDPPFPIEQIRFWREQALITMSGETFWYVVGPGWVSKGFPPSAVGIADGSDLFGPSIEVLPNPSPAAFRLSFRIPTEGPVAVDVLDVSGSAVRSLLKGNVPAGEYSLTWDARNDTGQDMPAGVYFARVITPDGEFRTRVVLVH